MGSALITLLVAGATLIAPALAGAAVETNDAPAPVGGATLDWSVKESFRNYIVGPIAKGSIEYLGNVTDQYRWSGGQGEAELDGSTANVLFGGGNGVHFRGHQSGPETEDPDTLDITLTNPRVVVISPTAGELRVDVEGREFVDTNTVGEWFESPDTLFASLTLPEPTVEGGVRSWSNAAAELTAEGAVAFAGFYEAGQDLDPVSFSLPTAGLEGDDAGEETGAVATTVVFDSSSTGALLVGQEAVFTVTVTPADAVGAVQFFNRDAALGDPVALQNGTATLRTKTLPVGAHSITATFTPTDVDAFGASSTPAFPVRVSEPSKTVIEVKGASLDWGVKASFRNYIYNAPAFGGKTTLLGATKQAQPKGTYQWGGGTGRAATNGTSADISFGKGNGVHFQSHPMKVGNASVYALDLAFTNPRVQITSPTSGTLYADVEGYEFKDMNSVGKKFSFVGAPLATLSLGIPEMNSANTHLTFKNVGARLTAQGAVAFGGFYGVGEELDPLNITLPGDFAVADKQSTSVRLSASPTSATVGESVKFTANVSPSIAGTVTFSYGSTTIGSPVRVSGGTAVLDTTRLPEGVYTAQALFLPQESERYHHANSNSVTLRIDAAKSPGGGAPGRAPLNGGVGAGSLRWGVSDYFAGYTTAKSNTAACPTPSGHCAGGSISTAGVGAGYLFPQSGSTWNETSHTGTVRYSGSVAFNGYGITMFRVASPTITVTSATSATLTTGYSGSYGPSTVALDLAAATKRIGAGGEVTWSNVPVRGSLVGISADQGIAFEPLTFTVGSSSRVTYSSTTQGQDSAESRYTAAEHPPATVGLEVLTDPEKIVPGGRIEVRAAGFDPEDEGVLVVLYPGQHVLDDTVKADSSGGVTWAGRLPADISPGPYTLTMQGSANVGAEIDVLSPEKAAAASRTVRAVEGALAAAEGGLRTAGVGAGMALWEWWVIAGGMSLIAGSTSALAIRQRL
ncbi:hypothetical protein SD72_09105 [Leucobacter komagatae]|uniref:Htaa domain-containing protein n=2 Tax=Leucobacter komagatae TaxID=55969 RepID=A0A0D0ISW1_9MICO|nr:hypothetical protein SD72_09105 [Leucobacter komagatae]